MNLAQLFGGLEATGIEAYQLSSGQPVSVTSVGGVPVVSTGVAATSNALLPIILIAAIALVLIFAL